MKVGGKDILKRTWKDLTGYISLEVMTLLHVIWFARYGHRQLP